MVINKMFFTLIFKNIVVRYNKTLIMLFSIILGASIICAFASIYLDINAKISKELRTFGANFFIGKKNLDSQTNIKMKDYKSALSFIDKKKIIGATPVLIGFVRLDLGNAVLSGVDFSEAKKINPFWQVEGSWVNVSFDERNCMIGKTLAKNMELKVGSHVRVIDSKSGFDKKLRVKGIIDSGAAADNKIFVNFGLAQKILGVKSSINYATLSLLYDAQSIQKLAKKINSNVSALKANPIRKISHSEGKILDKIKGLMAIITAMILIITTLCVNATMISSVSERAKEIGLQKAIGAKDSDIAKQFLFESAVISVMGIIIGIFIGYILAQIMGKAIFDSSIDIRLEVIPITFILSFVASMLASFYPIKKILLILPAKVLRGE